MMMFLSILRKGKKEINTRVLSTVVASSSACPENSWSESGDLAADMSRVWVPGRSVGRGPPLDVEDSRILAATSSEPHSLEEICEELSIASNECFTKVRRLESMGLLERIRDCETVQDTVVRVQNLYKAVGP